MDGHRTWLSALTEPDGTPCEDGPLRVEIGGESHTLDQAEVYARAILEFVKTATGSRECPIRTENRPRHA